MANRTEKHLRMAGESRIVRRSLACGQLEKLDDAKRYLEDGR